MTLDDRWVSLPPAHPQEDDRATAHTLLGWVSTLPLGLLLLVFARLRPGQPVVHIGPQTGPQDEAYQEDDNQEHHEWVRASSVLQPGGHAEEGGPLHRVEQQQQPHWGLI